MLYGGGKYGGWKSVAVGVCERRVAGENDEVAPTEAALKPGRWLDKRSDRSCVK